MGSFIIERDENWVISVSESKTIEGYIWRAHRTDYDYGFSIYEKSAKELRIRMREYDLAHNKFKQEWAKSSDKCPNCKENMCHNCHEDYEFCQCDICFRCRENNEDCRCY